MGRGRFQIRRKRHIWRWLRSQHPCDAPWPPGPTPPIFRLCG